MAYAKHYIIQSLGENNLMFTAELWEDGYVGDVVQLDGDLSPFIHKLLASSDNQFEPVLASTLSLSADVTIFQEPIPDFQNTDDRKYWVKLNSYALPASGKATILYRNFDFIDGPDFYDCNMQIWVNGNLTVELFTPADGQLTVNAGDIVEIFLTYFVPPPPADGNWQMIVEKDGSEVFNDTITAPVVGANQSYSFLAVSQSVYTAVTQSYNGGTPGPGLPVNTLFELWQGYLLNDEVRLPFTAGRLSLQFDNVDGLAMLKNIPYEPANPDINVLESLLQVIQTCLGKIELPDGYYLNICLSIFAEGMQDRGDDTDYEPFSQTYYAPRNWLQDETTYKSCYEVLETIMRNFGCQLFQSGAQWYVMSITERFEDQIYYTKYDQDSNIISSGQLTNPRTVKPWVDEATTPVRFEENQQTKILRKGFPYLEISVPAAYAPQILDNGFCLDVIGGFGTYRNWIELPSFGAITRFTTSEDFHGFLLDANGSGQPSVTSNSTMGVFVGDTINISFILGRFDTNEPKVQVKIKIVGIVNTYWLNNDKQWQGTDTNCEIVGSESPTIYQTANITTPAAPESGDLYVQWFGVGSEQIFIGSFRITLDSPYVGRKFTNSDVANPSYKQTLQLSMGAASYNSNNTQIGSLVDASGDILAGWHEYGSLADYVSLTELIYHQIFKIVSKASINFSAQIRSIYAPKDGETLYEPIRPADTFKVNDTTTCTISANGRSYIFGASEINYTTDTLNATILETSNEDLEPDVTETLTPKV